MYYFYLFVYFQTIETDEYYLSSVSTHLSFSIILYSLLIQCCSNSYFISYTMKRSIKLSPLTTWMFDLLYKQCFFVDDRAPASALRLMQVFSFSSTSFTDERRMLSNLFSFLCRVKRVFWIQQFPGREVFLKGTSANIKDACTSSALWDVGGLVLGSFLFMWVCIACMLLEAVTIAVYKVNLTSESLSWHVSAHAGTRGCYLYTTASNGWFIAQFRQCPLFLSEEQRTFHKKNTLQQMRDETPVGLLNVQKLLKQVYLLYLIRNKCQS